ncbi:hypothetical protein D3C86_1931860 [compost metagenome]
MQLNSKEYTKLYLKHSELVNGSILDFKMTAIPDTGRKLAESDFPYSFSRENKSVKK